MADAPHEGVAVMRSMLLNRKDGAHDNEANYLGVTGNLVLDATREHELCGVGAGLHACRNGSLAGGGRIELLAVRSSTTMMRSMWLPLTTTVMHWPWMRRSSHLIEVLASNLASSSGVL